MRLLKINNGVPQKYSKEQLFADNKSVSFPRDLNDDVLSSFDVYRYEPIYDPFDILTHVAVEGDFEDIDGKWFLRYNAQERPISEAEENIRSERNKRLADSDFMMLFDRTPTPMQIDYRQALRDVTKQVGFPYSVEWPVYEKENDPFEQN